MRENYTSGSVRGRYRKVLVYSIYLAKNDLIFQSGPDFNLVLLFLNQYSYNEPLYRYSCFR